jgi:hypothetical protein
MTTMEDEPEIEIGRFIGHSIGVSAGTNAVLLATLIGLLVKKGVIQRADIEAELDKLSPPQTPLERPRETGEQPPSTADPEKLWAETMADAVALIRAALAQE